MLPKNSIAGRSPEPKPMCGPRKSSISVLGRLRSSHGPDSLQRKNPQDCPNSVIADETAGGTVSAELIAGGLPLQNQLHQANKTVRVEGLRQQCLVSTAVGRRGKQDSPASHGARRE